MRVFRKGHWRALQGEKRAQGVKYRYRRGAKQLLKKTKIVKTPYL
jgi:hypothetical protein